MQFSVVIRCGRDSRVFDCISSIDEDVEIIVSTIDNPSFTSLLDSKGIRYCTTPPGNLSMVSNEGIRKASYDKVLVTDSDTVFQPGCLKYLNECLDRFSVARPPLEFRISNEGRFSRQVANTRRFVNGKQLAFTPGLAFRKDVIDKIGGFYFNDLVPFAVDADLNFRLKHYMIPVDYFGGPGLIHDAENVKHDLKAARRIGKGTKISAKSLAGLTGLDIRKICRELKAVHHSDYGTLLRQYGATTLLYQMLWDMNFYWGRMR